MKFLNSVKNLVRNENESISVDWVVLLAAVIGLGIAVLFVVPGGVTGLYADMSPASQ